MSGHSIKLVAQPTASDHINSIFFKQVQNIWPEKAAFQGATLPLVLSTKQDVDSPEHSPAPHGWWWGSVGVWREVPEATPVAPVSPAPQRSNLPLQLIGVQLQLRLQEAHLISVTHATTTSTHHVATHSTPSHGLLIHLLPSCHDGAASATPSVIAPASCNTTTVLKSHSGHSHNLYHPETTRKQVIQTLDKFNITNNQGRLKNGCTLAWTCSTISSCRLHI